MPVNTKENLREKEIIHNLILLLTNKLNPEKILLFGSRAKNNGPSNSDFDIAVTGDKINFRDLMELEEKIDEIAGLYSIDLIFMDSVEENFKNIILKTGKILYERKFK
ncbi:nucleotidyltransferase domain-containing protein [bacterium]|nr:nucleotidyltransferase domain-containing protein [bacterium]